MPEPKEPEKEPEKKPPKEDSLLAKASAVAERLEAANKITAELVERQENLKAREIIGGQTVAGTETPKKTADEISTENARNMLKGTGYEDRLFPVNPITK